MGWENGINYPGFWALGVLADEMHCTVDYLMGREDHAVAACKESTMESMASGFGTEVNGGLKFIHGVLHSGAAVGILHRLRHIIEGFFLNIVQVLNLGGKIVLDGGGEILKALIRPRILERRSLFIANYLPYYIVIRMSGFWIRLRYG